MTKQIKAHIKCYVREAIATLLINEETNEILELREIEDFDDIEDIEIKGIIY